MKKFIDKVFLLAIAVCFCGVAQAIEIPRITCELVENPIGIEAKHPRFGWQLISSVRGDRQTAYEILIASTPDQLDRNHGDMWSTGKVKSSESQFITYAGKALTFATRYFWKVRVWDVNGNVSSWSNTGYWEMAPLLPDTLQWIGAITKQNANLPQGRSFHSPSLKKKEVADMWNAIDTLAMRSIMLRKPFEIRKNLVKATVYVSGLGHYKFTINGKGVGNSEFAPHWSDYDKTVYYNIYQVDSMLTPGTNVVGILLGNGFYNAIGNRYRKLWVSFGPPTLFFQMLLQYADGSIERVSSDSSWKYTESPITFNCIYGGEDYDARKEQAGWDTPGFNDESWKAAVVQEAPKGTLRPQLAAPVRVMKQYDPKTTIERVPGEYLFDMGQNLSGYPTIRVQGKKGQSIKVLVGESLTKEGTVNQKRTGSPYYYQYTLKGEGIEEWHPVFSYYGFQYIQVEGADMGTQTTESDRPLLLGVKSNFIYNSAGETGNFKCSNELFNQAHVLINNAVKSNWQSVFTDCPHREKLGWLEETHLNGPGLFYTYDLAQFIPKIMQDIADGQRPDGLVPSIVPEYVVFGGDFTDSPEWGIASVVLPWMYYEHFGDKKLLVEYYPVMKKYVDYLTTRSENYIVSHGLGDWYDYGEHVAGYSKNSPIPLSATAHYFYGAVLLKKAAALLGNQDDFKQYDQLSNQIKVAYNNKFFHADTKQYGTGSQYSNAVSLFLDLVDPEYREPVLGNLLSDIRKHGNRLTTGDVGNRYLYQVLARHGYNDVMYDMHHHYDAPGYGFQIKFGLTTLTEQWDPRNGNSWNHFMMGQIDEWFYCSLAGILPDTGQPGFKHIQIKPSPVADLTYVESSIKTLYGEISVSWKITDDDKFILTVNVPVNSTASVTLPEMSGENILIDGIPISKVKSVSKIQSRKKTELRVGSGHYEIKTELKNK